MYVGETGRDNDSCKLIWKCHVKHAWWKLTRRKQLGYSGAAASDAYDSGMIHRYQGNRQDTEHINNEADRKESTSMKKVGFIVISILLLFSFISMIIVVIVYNGQFPRFNRHDTSITADLRYEDLQERYPRSLVR